MNLETLYITGEGSEKINKWINTHLSAFMKKQLISRLEKGTAIEIHSGDIQHIIDYFRSEKLQQHQRISRISVLEAHRQAKEWSDRLSKKNSAYYLENDQDVDTFMTYSNGYRWVQLKTEHSFKREGNLMGHCVSSFYTHKDTFIYSLRDHENLPHCTIEVRQEKDSKKRVVQNTVHQIKGRKDKSVIPKYHEYVIDFLNKNKYKIQSNDMFMNFLVKFQDKVYSTANLPENFVSEGGSLDIVNPLKLPYVLVAHYLKIVNVNPSRLEEYTQVINNRHGGYSLYHDSGHSSNLSEFVQLNKKLIKQNWDVKRSIDLYGVNILCSDFKTEKAKFINCLIEVNELDIKERLELIDTKIAFIKIKAQCIEFKKNQEVVIDDRIDCKLLLVKDVDHVIINTRNFINNIELINVKKVTILQTLNCCDLTIDNTAVNVDCLHKINLFNDEVYGNVEILNIPVLEELSFSNGDVIQLNCLKITNSGVKEVKNIKGLAIFNDTPVKLVNSSFELEY